MCGTAVIWTQMWDTAQGRWWLHAAGESSGPVDWDSRSVRVQHQHPQPSSVLPRTATTHSTAKWWKLSNISAFPATAQLRLSRWASVRLRSYASVGSG